MTPLKQLELEEKDLTAIRDWLADQLKTVELRLADVTAAISAEVHNQTP